MDTVTAPSYETYDDAGNPNASWFTRGTADQFATAGMSDMTYDADGNVESSDGRPIWRSTPIFCMLLAIAGLIGPTNHYKCTSDPL
jgi:hypothetical protein